MSCDISPSEHGFTKRMHELWFIKFPHSVITEQRLADQRRVIIRSKLLTILELEELKLETAEPKENEAVTIIPQEEVRPHPPDTEVPILQHLMLTERENGLKEKILQHMQVFLRQRLSTLPCKDLAKITRKVNKVTGTIPTVIIEDTSKLMYNAARLVTKELGYEVKSSTNERIQNTKLVNKIRKLNKSVVHGN